MDSHAIKLSGKAELDKPIEIGHNFRISLEGSVVSETVSDNDDGTKSHTYLFKPIIVETIDEKGERIRAKDTRSRSQQLRALLFKIWRQANVPQDFEEWYDREMLAIIETVAKPYL